MISLEGADPLIAVRVGNVFLVEQKQRKRLFEAEGELSHGDADSPVIKEVFCQDGVLPVVPRVSRHDLKRPSWQQDLQAFVCCGGTFWCPKYRQGRRTVINHHQGAGKRLWLAPFGGERHVGVTEEAEVRDEGSRECTVVNMGLDVLALFAVIRVAPDLVGEEVVEDGHLVPHLLKERLQEGRDGRSGGVCHRPGLVVDPHTIELDHLGPVEVIQLPGARVQGPDQGLLFCLGHKVLDQDKPGDWSLQVRERGCQCPSSPSVLLKF